MWKAITLLNIVCIKRLPSLPPAITVTLTKHGRQEFKSKKMVASLERPPDHL